jgi:hypothetical protein
MKTINKLSVKQKFVFIVLLVIMFTSLLILSINKVEPTYYHKCCIGFECSIIKSNNSNSYEVCGIKSPYYIEIDNKDIESILK